MATGSSAVAGGSVAASRSALRVGRRAATCSLSWLSPSAGAALCAIAGFCAVGVSAVAGVSGVAVVSGVANSATAPLSIVLSSRTVKPRLYDCLLAVADGSVWPTTVETSRRADGRTSAATGGAETAAAAAFAIGWSGPTGGVPAMSVSPATV